MRCTSSVNAYVAADCSRLLPKSYLSRRRRAAANLLSRSESKGSPRCGIEFSTFRIGLSKLHNAMRCNSIILGSGLSSALLSTEKQHKKRSGFGAAADATTTTPAPPHSQGVRCSRSSFAVLQVRLGSMLQQECCAVRVSKTHRVEQWRTAVKIDNVN